MGLIPPLSSTSAFNSGTLCKFTVLLRFYLFIFRERGREGEREGKKHQYVVASHVPTTVDLACIPSMCPDWESNQGPFGSQAGAQTTEPHLPELQFSCLSDVHHNPVAL